MPSSKSLQIINAGEGMEKRGPSYTIDGNGNWGVHYGDQYGGSLKTKNRGIVWSSNLTHGHVTRGNSDLRHMRSRVHYSTIYNSQDMEQPKCPSTDEWIKKHGILLSH